MSKGIVLIADDEPAVLETYQTILGGRHHLTKQLDDIESLLDDSVAEKEHPEEFTLVTAENGAEAIERHKEVLQSGKRIPVALLDMRMPPGMSGLDTAIELRKQDPNIYIIVITAYSDYGVDHLQSALKHDFILLGKPVTPDEFLQVTRNAVISYDRFQQMSHPLYFPSAAHETGSLKKGSVLVVDNDVLIQKLCAELLSRYSRYEVQVVGSGEEALALLESETFTPDLILLDVMMPGLDGYEVCSRIKADSRYEHVPIIFLTAKGQQEDVVQGFRAGGADYITKPFSQVELLARAVTHVHQYRQSLREQSRYKHSMLKVMGAINEGVVVTNHLGEITLVNDVVERMANVSHDLLLGQPLSSLFVEPLNREPVSITADSLRLLQQRLQSISYEHPKYCEQLVADAPLGLLEVSLETGQIEHANYRAQQLFRKEESELLKTQVEAAIPGLMATVATSPYGEMSALVIAGEPVTLSYLQVEVEGEQRLLLLLRSERFDLDWALIRLTAFGRLFERETSQDAQEWLLKCGAGEELPVLLQGGVYRDIEHQIEGGIITLVDLRERKRIESYQQYDAFQAGISEMSATILHNIGNAIQGIITGANQLEGKQREYVELIEMVEQFNQSELEPAVRQQRQEQLVQQLPQVMKTLIEGENEYSNLSPIDMIKQSAQHVAEIIQMHRRGFRMDQKEERTMLSQLMSDAMLLIGDKISKCGISLQEQFELHGLSDGFILPKNQLLQALINLLKNAVEAIVEHRQNGTGEMRFSFSVSATADHDPQALQLMIEVEDNGVGVSEESKRRLLEFGYSTKKRGSGFGLHATANFVRNLGGDIQIESPGVGRGALVRLIVPVVQE